MPELYPYNTKNSYKPRKPKKPILRDIFAVVFVIAVVFYLYNFTDIMQKPSVTINNSVTINYNQFTQVHIGDVISNDSVNIALSNVEFADEIVSGWSGVNQVYKAPDGNVCIRMDIDIKNTGPKVLTVRIFLYAKHYMRKENTNTMAVLQ